MILAIEEYRKIVGDYSSSDTQVKNKITFLERLANKVIKEEMNFYVKGKTLKKVSDQ